MSGINYERLYQHRFAGIDQDDRQKVWNEIGQFIYKKLGSPSRVLDPAAGMCEFLNSISNVDRVGVDMVDYHQHRDPEISFIKSNILELELPQGDFDGIFVSNFLEHLPTQDDIADFLSQMFHATKESGMIAILGPNFRYCPKEYFDCADHTIALTHVSIEEHLYASGFDIVAVFPRFLPFSFRGILPPSPLLTRLYLRFPLAWKLLGKQFLVIGKKSAVVAPSPSR